MSSKAFPARTTHSENDPQLCGLHESSGCCASLSLDEGQPEADIPGAIVEGDLCFYLTCRGNQAVPTMQIQSSKKSDGYSTGFRITPTGQTRTVGKPPFTRQQPIFKWQEQDGSGRWHDVAVWEKMVHVSCAQQLGYAVPAHKGKAFKGNRTRGMAHRVNKNPISVVEELAAIAYEGDQIDAAEAQAQE